MTDSMHTPRRPLNTRAAVAAALALVLVGALVALWLRPPLGRPEQGAAAEPNRASAMSLVTAPLRGYPGPTASAQVATPTPEPDADGRYPAPEGIPYEVVAAADSPHAQFLSKLCGLLDREEADDLAAWVGAPNDVLALDFYSESEGIGARPTAGEVADLLDELFQAGSAPVVQGYFDPEGGEAGSGGGIFVVISGLQGQVPMPTKDPNELLGRGAPADMPTGSAAWEVYVPSDGEEWWRAWWMGEGYYELLVNLSDRGLGTYFVLR